ncbi:MAG: hypothetical protein V4714_02745 [Bacteroidota bacterium]
MPQHLASPDNRRLWEALAGDGRFFLTFTGLILILSGLFVIIQSITGHFLPHDVSYLGLTAQQLSRYHEGKITHFMFHDRVAFGGSIIAVGCIYMWLVEFPLKQGQAWAWWLLLLSGITGFGSFLTYLGHGYLDSWHGMATLMLLPFYSIGLVRTYARLTGDKSIWDILKVTNHWNFTTRTGIGITLLLFTGFGLFAGGLTIMFVGMTAVFVPQDLVFMHATVHQLRQVEDHLIPLIAHDRSCFGGGLATIGLIIFFTIRRAEPTRNLWEILLVSLTIGFTFALGVHFVISYTDVTHLLPAYLGVVTYLSGLGLTFRTWHTQLSQPTPLQQPEV